MIAAADFDEAYNTKACNTEKPVCKAPECFIGSYAPVPKPGEEGPFNMNSYFLQPNRYLETVGPVPVRSVDFKC
jgi:hypothetical protein